MVSQITFTDDVGRIAAASNDGSLLGTLIIWYCYERPYLTGTSIFVQREVAGVLSAEVRFLAEGEKPEIFFDPVTSQWIFTYVLNEKLYMITIGETDAPVTQSSQTGTLIDHLRSGATTRPDERTAADRGNQQDIAIGFGDADNSPRKVNAMAIGASSNPGVTFAVRWRAAPSTTASVNLNVAGFNIYVRRYTDGALYKANTTMVPFVGFDPHVYEAEVPAVPGTYYVTQVSYAGDASGRMVEGRIRPTGDEVLSDGTTLPSVIADRLGPGYGSGFQTEDLTFTFVDTRAANVLQADTFQQTAYGEGLFASATIINDYDTVQVVSGSPYPPLDESFLQSAYGSGLRLFLSSSSSGIITVG